MGRMVFNVFGVVILVLGIYSTAKAVSSYKNQFNSRYGTTGTTLDQCLLCHTSNSSSALNPYGNDFASNGHNFAAIEPLDSDGDGFSNLVEINARTFPGNASSKPASTNGPPARPQNLRLR